MFMGPSNHAHPAVQNSSNNVKIKRVQGAHYFNLIFFDAGRQFDENDGHVMC